MRDNEFDKGVQEKMGEFRLQPSAPVWMAVERRIRERKRRRILFFWFCMAGLLLAGLGGWWVMNTGDQSSSITKSGMAKTKPFTNTTVNKHIDKTTVIESVQEQGVNGNKEMKVVTDGQQPEKKNRPLNPQTEKKIIRDGKFTAGNAKKLKKAIEISADQQQVEILTGSPKKSGTNSEKKKAPMINETAEAMPVTQTIPPPAAITSLPAEVIAPANNGIEPKGESIETVSENIKPADTAKGVVSIQELSSIAPLKKTSKKHNWQTGLLFAFGESKLTSGGISLFKNKSFDLFQSGGAATGNNPGGNYNNQSFADSIPLKGTAFHTGVFAKRKTGKKTAFSTGLNLAYYSGKQRVGAFIDSVRRVNSPFNADTRDGFYRAGSNARYTNRYYFLQVPLLFHWQLNKGNKLPPIQWENGLVPSVMLGSRALVYDPGGRIFFRDKSVYNSFSLLFQTGFTAEFAGQTKHPLTAGVYYNYQFSRLQKVNPPDYNYLSSYGIQFRWLIKK